MLTIEIYANQAKEDSHNNPKEPFGEKMKLIWAGQKKIRRKVGSQGAFRMKEKIKSTPLKFNKMREFEYKKIKTIIFS